MGCVVVVMAEDCDAAVVDVVPVDVPGDLRLGERAGSGAVGWDVLLQGVGGSGARYVRTSRQGDDWHLHRPHGGQEVGGLCADLAPVPAPGLPAEVVQGEAVLVRLEGRDGDARHGEDLRHEASTDDLAS